MIYSTKYGKAHPLGATPEKEGVNFSLYSENATGVELLIFDNETDICPSFSIKLDHHKNRTFNFWHIFLEGLTAGKCYAYRVDGEFNPEKGYRFNPAKIIIDPYAKGVSDAIFDRAEACHHDENIHASLKGLIIDTKNYNWEDDTPPNIPLGETIIYEAHVKGFTRHDSSAIKNKGTFRGMIEKIPYLKELGITAVELLPVFNFDNKHPLRYNQEGQPLYNYWGYSTIGFFALEENYCSDKNVFGSLDEFRDMIKAMHREGIEVILDVVYNHTDEGNHEGPVMHFKGIDNSSHYQLKPDNKKYYMDYTGCGNTFNCNHPINEKFVSDSLKFWVQEMHVDGFRFDEGSVLSRGEDGTPLKHPPLLWDIELDDTFANTKLITEAWDAAGLYQIGSFSGYRWSEWNGRFRDDVRRFVRGDSSVAGAVASRLAGSSDLYQQTRHSPVNSVNFICCHDGFTMMDLVSYNSKHNEANGENSRDGIDENQSCNYGAEGETDNLEIINFRKKQIKNFASILLLSRGIPMILSGDEIGRTQNGNNNAYCQDNEISWTNWTLLEKNQEIFRFFREMIRFRKQNEILCKEDFYNTHPSKRGLNEIEWHGCKLNSPGWNDASCKVLSFTLRPEDPSLQDIHVMMNMDEMPLSFEIPDSCGKLWCRVVDTDLASPDDIAEPGKEKPLTGNTYPVNSHSIAILITK
jgi:isoamylase